MSVLDASLGYAEAGISLLPIEGKRPFWPMLPQQLDVTTGELKYSWNEYQKRRAGLPEIRHWFDDRRVTGIAAVCGTISPGTHTSGGLFVIDVDEPELIPAFKDRCGSAWHDVLIQDTPSGGLHLAMVCDGAEELSNMKLAMKKDGKKSVVRIETRGTGGYIMMAPSLHPLGTRYTVRQKSWNVVPKVSDDLVMQLIVAAQSFNEVIEPSIVRAETHFNGLPGTLSSAKLIIEEWKMQVPLIDALLSHGYTVAGRRRMNRPGANPRLNMPSVLLTEDGRASYHFSENDELRQRLNALGQPFHDSASVEMHLAHGGEMHAFLEAASERFNMAYRKPSFAYKPEIARLPKPRPQDKTWDILDDGDATKPLLIVTDSPEAAAWLLQNGVSATIVPTLDAMPHILPGPWKSQVRAYAEVYVWMTPPHRAQENVFASDILAKLVKAPWGLDTFLERSSAPEAEIAFFFQSAERPEHALLAEDMIT